jgi:hypothetical protein
MRIQLFSDETKAIYLNFLITTYIWGTPGACRLFNKEISDLVNKNQIALGGNFTSFHANRLGINNWHKISKYYLQVLKIFFKYIEKNMFRSLIYIESNEKRAGAWNILEGEIKRLMINSQPSKLNYIFSELDPSTRSAIIKSSIIISGYILNMHFFGDDLEIEYYPDASGNIIRLRTKKLFLKSPTFLGRQATFSCYEIIKMIMNILGPNFQRLRLNARRFPVVNHRITNFEPIKAKQSFIIQAADIISNYFYNMIQFVAGERKEIVRRKALTLLGFDAFRRNISNFKDNFVLKNGIPYCVNPKMEARLKLFVES